MPKFTVPAKPEAFVLEDDSPTFIVAEMSSNHAQDLSRAKQIIDAAAESGANAIKLQTYTADTLTIPCDRSEFLITEHTQWKGLTLYQLYKQAYTPWEWHRELMSYAQQNGLFFFSTPFDRTAVEFLEQLDIPCYKVASFMTENLPLLQVIGETRKPVILSRGLTTLDELDLALETLTNAGCPEIAILHCVSAYPSPASEMHLANIPDLQKRYHKVVGLSDHTLTDTCALASVAMGGKILEKHLTLSRKDPTADQAFSIEPQELKHLVSEIRLLEKAIGKPDYTPSEIEEASRIFKQSIIVVKNIEKGEIFTEENVRIIRPGYGLPPKFYYSILGKKAREPLSTGTPLLREMIE